MNIGRILCIGYTTNTGQLNTLTYTQDYNFMERNKK